MDTISILLIGKIIKKTLPKLPQDSFDIAVGMILGDATMYYVSREALIKFEQGVKQK